MLYPLLEENARKYSQKIAFQIKRNGKYECYTYAQALEYSRKFAFRLTSLGVAPGDRVALWAESIPEWGLAYLGIHFAGAVVVPLDYQYRLEAVSDLLRFAGAKAIVCAGELLEQSQKIAAELGIEVLTLEPDGGEESLFSSADTPENYQVHTPDPDDTMSLIFTSGTTGDPKGVMLTCRNLVGNAQAMKARELNSTEDVFICVLPLHHCYAFTGTFMLPLISGCSVTYQPVLKGPEILGAIRDTGATIMLGVPQLFNGFAQTMQERIKSQPFLKRSLFHLLYSIARRCRKWFGWNLGRVFFSAVHKRFGDAFRLFVSGGAKADPETAEFFWNIGIPMVEGYGLTETSPVICCSFQERYFPASVGNALEGIDVRIDSPDTKGVGEVAMRGPNLMKGYYQNESATAKVIKDGWFYTGDLGYLDKRGFLYITGRAKEVIVLESGKNIYPDEVERHYENDPLIGEMCVFGEKEADRVKFLSALIVPDMEEVQRRKINSIRTEIKFNLENMGLKIPSYMRVNSFKIVSEPFPRTRLGKLKRSLIEKSYYQESKEPGLQEEQMSEEDRKLLAGAACDKFLSRLQGMLRRKEQIVPAHSLELDLGLDSIKRMELLVVLEQEFGVKLSEQESEGLLDVRDILKLLPSEMLDLPKGEFDWQTLLEKEQSPSLDEMFNLRRGRFKNFLIDIIRWITRIVCRICFGLKIDNFDKMDDLTGAALIAPSHQSYIDAMLIYCSLPSKVLHRTVFIALDKMFSSGPMALLVRPGRVIRSASSSTAVTSLQYAAQALKKGMCVCIFPEGQRSVDGRLSPPMPGAGILCCEYSAPMVPIVVQGAMGTFSRTNPGFHFANASLEMLSPIPAPKKRKFEEKDYRDAVNAWYRKVAEKTNA